MTDSADTLHPHIETTAEIVAAYVSRNSVPVSELPNLIRSVHDSLSKLGTAPAVEAPAPKREPAVSIRKSITDEYLISLEDGRKFKSMKRYLSGLGMTPADYRAKWNLPADYPMVAPAYAAEALGAGEDDRPRPDSPAALEPSGEDAPDPARRGRSAGQRCREEASPEERQGRLIQAPGRGRRRRISPSPSCRRSE